MKTDTDDELFQSEEEYQEYLTELERERIAYESRSPEAIRQDRCRKRRNTAKMFYTLWLRNGTKPPEKWIEGISDAILKKARADVIKENQHYAKLRGWE